MIDVMCRYALLGDIHSNLEALNAVLADAQHQGCTHYACLGDIVGYNANPKECLEIVRRMNMPCVKGNHDEYGASECPLDLINGRAAAGIQWTRQQLTLEDKQWLNELKYVRALANFTLVHATLDEPERWGYVFDKLLAAASFTYQTTAVCFYGHTHVPMAFVRDGSIRGGTFSTVRVEPGRKYFVNVGSVGEPRDGNPRAAYVIYDLPAGTIELRRVDYDFELAEAKNRAAGLPLRRPAR
jgi:diadenosine tetraphosphatase ApaH/serine/threonine PP2A family protein phosphatase